MKLFFIFIILSPFIGFAQPYETNPDFKRANHWFFGDSVWLDFNFNPPQSRNGSQLSTIEPSTSYSDVDGNLLLYSNGLTIWNNKHEVIQNGTGILGHSSSSQGAVFVPLPNNDSMLYLFTTDASCGNNGLRYTTIKIHGNPDSVIVVEKNIFVNNGLTESIKVTKHANNIDFWIVVHSSIGNTFYAYLLTENGLAACPITTQIGYMFDGHFFNCQTTSDFSLKGDKFVLNLFRDYKVMTLDFSNSTGEFSSYKQYDNIITPTGLAFSANDSFVYVVERDKGIRRINLIDNTYDTITQINAFEYFMIQVSLSPNGDIYCNILDSTHLAILSNINSVAPVFNLKGISVENNRLTNGLPNYVKSYFYTPSISFTLNLNCVLNTIQLYGQDTFNANIHNWLITKQGLSPITNNTKAPLIEFEDTGIYKIQYIASNGVRSDTITKEVKILPKIEKNFLGNDTGWCEQLGTSLTIQAPQGMHCYEWNTGETGSLITADTPGIYSIKITTPNFCVLYDTITVTIDTVPNAPTIYRDNDTLKTDAIAERYQWLKDGSPTGTNSPRLILIDTGEFQLKIISNGGCTAFSDTIHIPDTSTNSIYLIVSNGIKIYPNPFNNKIEIIDINNNVSKITVYTINGQILYRGNSRIIDTSLWNDGVYMIAITLNNGQQITHKLLKQNN